MKKSTKICGIAFSLGLGAIAGASAFAAPINTAFTDDAFYKCVIEASNADVNHGGNGTSLTVNDNITDAQLASITTLSCDGTGVDESAKISNIAGIEKMTGLENIDLSHNNIQAADFSHNGSLEELFINYNKLTSLVLPGSAVEVQVNHNDENAALAIDASDADDLEYLDIEHSKLALPLDLSEAVSLTTMKVSHTNLDTLDLTHNPNIQVVQNFDIEDLILKVDVDFEEVAATDTTPAAYTVDITRIYGTGRLVDSVNPYIDCGESLCTFDSTTKKITIKSPDKINGSIRVGAYKIYVPLGDLDVPNTSVGEIKENPNTSESSKLVLGIALLGAAALGVVAKAIVSAYTRKN